jgi:uncharacterized membrane protein YphA (DoxX/SURF4 family)
MLKTYRFSLRKVLMIEATVDHLRFGWIIVAASVIIMSWFTILHDLQLLLGFHRTFFAVAASVLIHGLVLYHISPQLSNEAHVHLSEGVLVPCHSFDHHVFLIFLLPLLDLLWPGSPTGSVLLLCCCRWIPLISLYTRTTIWIQSSVATLLGTPAC